MTIRLDHPIVHGRWTAEWFAGSPRLVECFGPAPSLAVLTATADRLRERRFPDWTQRLRVGHDIPTDALVVLAGQQPVLGGGAALVAHKAATAIALARQLAEHLQHPVVPVFLLATQDHDSSEVDHLDLYDGSNGLLKRIRCPLSPQHEMFSRSSWNTIGLKRALRDIVASSGVDKHQLDFLWTRVDASETAAHVVELLRASFESLALVEAHAFPAEAAPILRRALEQPADLQARLATGTARLRELGLPVAFDPADPRPLVLESRAGRRRRLEADDAEALTRLGPRPEDFSPHAALRPVVQAACLPVVAQVAGPSELLYLGQARGLHEPFDVVPPVLVPRLEATRARRDPAAVAEDLARLDDPARTGDREAELVSAAREFARDVGTRDAGLLPRLDRFVASIERGARRLAEAPTWRGRPLRRDDQELRPRGRPQDAVLAWVPDAWSRGRPAEWAAHILSLCDPLQAPVHVVHTLPGDPADG